MAAKKAPKKAAKKAAKKSVKKTTKKAVKKAPAKKTTKKAPKKAAKKVVKKPAKKAAKRPVKKAPRKVVKKAPAKKSVKKAPVKKSPPPKKVAPKAEKPEKVAKPVKKAPVVEKPPPPPPPPKPLKPLPDDFLKEMKEILLAERAEHEQQANVLLKEAEELANDWELGDVQFDEESGEGGTMAIDRDRDLQLSAQAQQAIDDIDRALAKIQKKTYGYCENCRNPIPKARLKALPFAELCVDCKTGGLSRRI